MASNNVFNKLKKKELTEDERTEMREKFADVSISTVKWYAKPKSHSNNVTKFGLLFSCEVKYKIQIKVLIFVVNEKLCAQYK